MALVVRNPPADAGDTNPRFHPWVRKSALEEEMETCSSNLAWKIPWTEVAGGL